MNKFLRMLSIITISVVSFGALGFAQAEKSTLITLKNGKPVAALAKSWKKTGAGKFEFQLDPAGTIGKKKPLTPEAVKASLEGKLGSAFGVTVTAKGKAGVEVAFTGEDAPFLEAVSTTKIRASKGIELALESSTTQGGIRARANDRPPTAEEVKGTVITNSKGVVTVRVLELGSTVDATKIKVGDKAAVTFASDVKSNDLVFFVPDTEEKGVWKAKALAK